MTAAESQRPIELTVRLRMAPEAVVGPPLFAEVTLANETEGSEYYDLLHCTPFQPPFPIEFTFSSGMERVVLPARSTSGSGARRRGFALTPGEARTFVVDLSELEVAPSPGTWACDARWIMRHEEPRSPPVQITLNAPNPEDLPLLAGLRRLGGAGSPRWINFIRDPDALANRVLFQSLSDQARSALVPYFILHQVVHGPESLSAFPLAFLAQHLEGPWGSEAGVLSWELLWARGASDLAQRKQALLQRWPGVAFRLSQIEAGNGLLTTLKRTYGPERAAP